MSQRSDPQISKSLPGGDFTCISFRPDLKRFKMDKLDSDIISLLSKRVYDIAGTTEGRVKVKLNGQDLSINNFSQYVDLYLGTKDNKDLPKIVDKKSDRWEVVCSLSDG
jgi:DNA topoisomerase-2